MKEPEGHYLCLTRLTLSPGASADCISPGRLPFFIYLCLAYVSTIHCQRETPLPSSPTEGFWEEETSLPLAAM